MSKGKGMDGGKAVAGEIDTSKPPDFMMIEKTVKRIEMDARSPCRYNGVMSLEFVGIPGGAIYSALKEPQVPFRIRRIITDSTHFWIEQLTVGVNLQLQVSYNLRISSEILMSDRHPIEWGSDGEDARRKVGLDAAQVGVQIAMKVVNRAASLQGMTVLLLGDAVW